MIETLNAAIADRAVTWTRCAKDFTVRAHFTGMDVGQQIHELVIGFKVAWISDRCNQKTDEYNWGQECNHVGRNSKLLVYSRIKVRWALADTYLGVLWGIGRQGWIAIGTRRQLEFYDSVGEESEALSQPCRVRSKQAPSEYLPVPIEGDRQRRLLSSLCKSNLDGSQNLSLLPSVAKSGQVELILDLLHSW